MCLYPKVKLKNDQYRLDNINLIHILLSTKSLFFLVYLNK